MPLSSEEYDEYYLAYRRSIQAIARRIAGTNDDLCQELEQIGRIALWKFDPTRAHTNLEGLIKRHLRNRMIDYIRSTYNRQQFDPLFETDFDQADLWVDETGNVRVVQLRPWDSEGDYYGG
jgi:DNA-directed RNA polymerase specialized sigma24 family protein